MRPRDIALALLIAVIWGFNFVAIRMGLAGLPPMLLVAVRFALSAFPAILFVPRPVVAPRYLLLYGLFMGVGQAGLLYGGIKLGMPAGLASIVAQSQAFFTLLLASIFLHERIFLHNVVGACVAFAGLALIALRFDASVPAVGLLMTLGAAFSWGCGNIVTRKLGRVDPVGLSVWSSLIPPIPMFLLSVLLEGVDAPARVWQSLGVSTIIATAYTAYLATILCYALWAKLIGEYGAGRVAPFSMLVPFFGVTGIALVFGEPITTLTMVAGALIMAGLTIHVFGARFLRRRSPSSYPAR